MFGELDEKLGLKTGRREEVGSELGTRDCYRWRLVGRSENDRGIHSGGSSWAKKMIALRTII